MKLKTFFEQQSNETFMREPLTLVAFLGHSKASKELFWTKFFDYRDFFQDLSF